MSSRIDELEQVITLTSPGGGVEAFISVRTSGRLTYTVCAGGNVIIEPSDLGITVDGADLGLHVEIEAFPIQEIKEEYATRGNHPLARNHYCELRAAVKHMATGMTWELYARCYEDGFAYRYVLSGDGPRRIHGEASAWTMPQGSNVWFFERNNDWKLKSYAGEWLKTPIESLHTVSSQGPVQGTPLVFELADGQGYAAIMEAALYDYSGMRIEACGGRKLRVHFTEGDRGFIIEGIVKTPWRVVMISPDLNRMVNSDLITNLNPPPSKEWFADMLYIRPGRSVWRWWSLGTGSPEEERHMIDCAQKLGFEYTTIDEGWEKWKDPWTSLYELTQYAGSCDVGVFVWKRSKEINDPTDHWKSMRDFFNKVKAAGCVGLKIDFIDCEDKRSVDFEIHALRIAAELRLMINFHGISKPTGEARTYPNEISREGIRGLELNKMKEGPIPAFHNAALPFTRLVAGHGDYTPVGFSNPGHTTWAHQLATAVIFTSPLQVIAENPDLLLNDERVRPALDILRIIPSVWDETRVLTQSVIGELAVFARRHGKSWFVALLNGTEQEQIIGELDLSFLSEGAYHGVHLYSVEPAALERKDFTLEAEERQLQVRLHPVDGAVIWLSPINGESGCGRSAIYSACSSRQSAFSRSGLLPCCQYHG